jgi:DNA repair ATPase RecN
MCTAIILSRWAPAWAHQIAMKLNSIHADIKWNHRIQEKIMAEVEDLKAAEADLAKEVSEAIAKFNDVAAKLDAAAAKAEDADELKAAVDEATSELKANAARLDQAFATQTFEPSQN